MSSILNRLINSIAIGSIFVVVILFCGIFAGLRINTTKSIPLGFYWIINAPITKCAYVILCPPKNKIFDEAKKRNYISPHACDAKYGYMMKRVVAVQDDFVSISAEGVRINGKYLPLSKPQTVDAAGGPVHRYPLPVFTVAASDVFLMSDVSSTSFDGRYFGPINRRYIKGVVRPILTW